jgi:hypothetical protein
LLSRIIFAALSKNIPHLVLIFPLHKIFDPNFGIGSQYKDLILKEHPSSDISRLFEQSKSVTFVEHPFSEVS